MRKIRGMGWERRGEEWNDIAMYKCHLYKHGRLDVFKVFKVKIDYLILDAKFLLININYEEFFFLEIL